jgi:hypothetical protein
VIDWTAGEEMSIVGVEFAAEDVVTAEDGITGPSVIIWTADEKLSIFDKGQSAKYEIIAEEN